jgi:hypothetical protein
MKTVNVRPTGRASVCAFEDAFFGQWVQAEGAASIESLPGAMEGLGSLLSADCGRPSRLGRLSQRHGAGSTRPAADSRRPGWSEPRWLITNRDALDSALS